MDNALSASAHACDNPFQEVSPLMFLSRTAVWTFIGLSRVLMSASPARPPSWFFLIHVPSLGRGVRGDDVLLETCKGLEFQVSDALQTLFPLNGKFSLTSLSFYVRRRVLHTNKTLFLLIIHKTLKNNPF